MDTAPRGSFHDLSRAGCEGSRLHASDLPEGYVALRRVRALPLLGRWSPLEDRMPPWLPFQCMVEMARRNHEGDPDAHAWLELYRRAAQGDSAAQLVMGHVCETGTWGTAIDIQRAFFWYYRAGLAGDEEASENALRLKGTYEISRAAMDEPALLYPGQWRITRADLDGKIAIHLVELAANGRCTAHSFGGRWTYDKSRLLLTLDHADTWPISLLGCRDSRLFGRDREMATYIIERMAPATTRPGKP
jgi:hypothetical protein